MCKNGRDCAATGGSGGGCRSNLSSSQSHPGVSKQNIAQRKEGWVLSRGDILSMSLQIAFGSRLSRASLFLWGKSSVTEGCLWILSPEDFFSSSQEKSTEDCCGDDTLLDIAGFLEFLLLIHHCFSLLHLCRVFLRERARFLGTCGHACKA